MSERGILSTTPKCRLKAPCLNKNAKGKLAHNSRGVPRASATTVAWMVVASVSEGIHGYSRPLRMGLPTIRGACPEHLPRMSYGQSLYQKTKQRNDIHGSSRPLC